MAGASISGRVRPWGLGCAAARVPSRALRIPRHLPESRPPSLVGRDADGGAVLREDRARAAGQIAAPADAFIGGRRTSIPGRVASGHDRCAAIADEEPGLCAPAPVSGRPHGRSRVSQGREMQLDSQLPVAPGALISGVQQVSPSSQAPKVPLARLR